MEVSIRHQTFTFIPTSRTNEDSDVNLQAQVMRKHKKCLRFSLKIFEEHYFQNQTHYTTLSCDYDCDDGLISLKQFLHLHYRSHRKILTRFLRSIKRKPALKRLLTWTFKIAPRFMTHDLLWIFIKVYNFVQESKCKEWSYCEKVMASGSLDFQELLFMDSSLQIFNLHSMKDNLEALNFSGTCMKIEFIKFFSMTLLLALTYEFEHPLYEIVKAVEEKQRDVLREAEDTSSRSEVASSD